jgi:hypothetical protein
LEKLIPQSFHDKRNPKNNDEQLLFPYLDTAGRFKANEACVQVLTQTAPKIIPAKQN